MSNKKLDLEKFYRALLLLYQSLPVGSSPILRVPFEDWKLIVSKTSLDKFGVELQEYQGILSIYSIRILPEYDT